MEFVQDELETIIQIGDDKYLEKFMKSKNINGSSIKQSQLFNPIQTVCR